MFKIRYTCYVARAAQILKDFYNSSLCSHTMDISTNQNNIFAFEWFVAWLCCFKTPWFLYYATEIYKQYIYMIKLFSDATNSYIYWIDYYTHHIDESWLNVGLTQHWTNTALGHLHIKEMEV